MSALPTKSLLAKRIVDIAPEIDYGFAIRVAKNLRDEGWTRLDKVTTSEELEDAIRRSFEEGEHLVLMSGTRPWIIWEDDHGLAHVSSAPYEDDPERLDLGDIALPAVVVHVGTSR